MNKTKSVLIQELLINPDNTAVDRCCCCCVPLLLLGSMSEEIQSSTFSRLEAGPGSRARVGVLLPADLHTLETQEED